ncbi:peptidylprolyl isomerase [Hyunsoonleella pacifica]|uniref:Periplasmic chaperone PpiD n=1 Tax=Hyunsoonleella pacifica TaxID=1080224 RepID=A0A4Q9FNF3_9FLAO|nr:SurA N-terminal domain-containing protein [Hyunsoonleella pacifica]TBN14716.1 peptidylprolyl isomerase [Hyunsoonleella pacifica]GGD16086.1 peptidylprolyl isomerase [Hyunsoonleella pacifica]
MAVLNKIRQRSLFLILIIALALFSFVLADLFRNSDALSARSQNTVATINGKDINREDFLKKVENTQRQMGPNATNTQVINRVWNQEVREAVLSSQYEKLGISIEKDQMRDLLKTALTGNPQFSNEAGLFDEGKLNEYIANLKNTSEAQYQSWIDYEKSVASNALQQNYFNLVKAGLVGTLAEGKLEHQLEGNKVDMKFVQIPYTKVADSTIKVTKSDIEAYIKDHKSQYEVEASRDIKFVEFKEVATVADEDAIQKDLKTFITGRIKDKDGRTDPIDAFSTIENNEEYINLIAASDVKFDDRFVFKSSLPAKVSDSIYGLSKGEIYGPYRDGEFFKITKLIETKNIPDSAKVRHILIPFIGSQSSGAPAKQTEQEAKATADSLLAILKRNKSKFPEFVKEFSSDQGSVANEGRYDWHAYGTMVPEFNDFEFNGRVGDIDVVKTIFGFHIVEIEGLKDKKKAVKVGTIARKVEPSEATVNAIFRDASNFEIKAKEGDFEEIAKSKNYTVRPVNGMKALDENIPGIGNQRPIVRWAFEEEVKEGDIKRFTVSGGYVIAQLVAKHEEGLMIVEDASATVLPKIRKERKAEIIKQRVTATALEDVATAESTSVRTALAVNMKNPTISGAGREPLVVGTAFALEEGETSALVAGERGVYMVQVTKKTPAVELDNYQSFANRVETQKSSVVNSKLYNALKDAADIEDNRVELQIQ